MSRQIIITFGAGKLLRRSLNTAGRLTVPRKSVEVAVMTMSVSSGIRLAGRFSTVLVEIVLRTASSGACVVDHE
jgi:hypothetical protein